MQSQSNHSRRLPFHCASVHEQKQPKQLHERVPELIRTIPLPAAAGRFDWGQTRKGGVLQQICGADSIQVNSLHSFLIADLAPGLVAEAVAEDGSIEAVSVEGVSDFGTFSAT
ncbi:gamma-glutamyl-gamma-aminobutyrate hydrolase family protein [Bradyrhizobium agreste]|uniref:gamma-glutamyl-gamma-aminobutyrate hydrolase family protein n=1 Tax=Bradyrhizobium agreste TaxID=2751811 RepID=UPI0028A21669|nr:gamma-glutamyl-gamma-aminobutyrate hydrolase family protein [Bradyrhizobium agreste]